MFKQICNGNFLSAYYTIHFFITTIGMHQKQYMDQENEIIAALIFSCNHIYNLSKEELRKI